MLRPAQRQRCAMTLIERFTELLGLTGVLIGAGLMRAFEAALYRIW